MQVSLAGQVAQLCNNRFPVYKKRSDFPPKSVAEHEEAGKEGTTETDDEHYCTQSETQAGLHFLNSHFTVPVRCKYSNEPYNIVIRYYYGKSVRAMTHVLLQV